MIKILDLGLSTVRVLRGQAKGPKEDVLGF